MGASFEEVVTGAESLRPVLLLKAVVNSVTFRLTTTIIITTSIIIIIIIIIFITIRREASIKQEGIVGAEEEEAIPLEHYAMLEVVHCLPISIDWLILLLYLLLFYTMPYSRMPSACMTQKATAS